MRQRKPIKKAVLVYMAGAGVPFYHATVNTKGMTEPEKKKLFKNIDALAKAAFQMKIHDK